MEEVWRGAIYQGLNYSERFEVSNTGKLRSTKTKKEYKPIINPTGYFTVTISLGSRKDKKTFKIHKLVAEVFISNPDKLPIVNHKDGNKLHNCESNLEWCTASYNTKHAFETGLTSNEFLCKPISGINKLDGSIINFKSLKEASDWCFEIYGFTFADRHIWKSITGKRKSAYGYKWYYDGA